MKKATLTLGAGLILLTGWLLVPGIASAQALQTSIEGSHVNCTAFGNPEREWVDEDGITHFRGQRYRCNHDGDVQGQEVGVSDGDFDPDALVRFEHGTMSFGGKILGVLSPATGHWTLECTGTQVGMLNCTEEDVWHLEDGRLLKFTVTFVGPDFPRPYTGILLDPPGLRLGANRKGR